MAETKETGEKAVKFGKTQDVSLKTIERLQRIRSKNIMLSHQKENP